MELESRETAAFRRLTHEPRVSLAVLEEMLAPYVSSGRVGHADRPPSGAADVERDRIRAVSVQGESLHTIHAAYFLDATEQGDLLPLARAEYTTGAESRKQTGEPHAPAKAAPATSRASPFVSRWTTCQAKTTLSTSPQSTTSGATTSPKLRPPWPGKLLSWTMSNPVTLEDRELHFDPTLEPQPRGALNLWLYRRIADKQNFAPGTYAERYHTGELAAERLLAGQYQRGERRGSGASSATREATQPVAALLDADRGPGMEGAAVASGCRGTEDGLAQYPYIRESRRIRGGVHGAGTACGTEKPRKEPGESFAIRWASAATGSTCIRAPAATTISTWPACRSRSRWAR